MRCPSAVASGESNRHNSTLVACSEKSAKLTPFPSHVAPKGKGRPGHTLMHGSPRVGFDSLCRGGRPRVVLRIVSQTPRTIKPGEQDLYRSGFTDGVCASEWLNFRGCLDRESDSLGPVIPLENVFKRERACLRETAFAQACFDRSQFDGLLVGFSQDVLRVVPERAALQEILQLLPLLLDRLDPAIRPMVRLMLPLEEVQKQGFETAKDLSPIASCHVGKELVQVLVVQLAKSPFGYKASHHVQPGSLIPGVQVAIRVPGSLRHSGWVELRVAADERTARLDLVLALAAGRFGYVQPGLLVHDVLAQVMAKREIPIMPQWVLLDRAEYFVNDVF